jgi:hypothetical protein
LNVRASAHVAQTDPLEAILKDGHPEGRALSMKNSRGPLHNKMGDSARDTLELITIMCGANDSKGMIGDVADAAPEDGGDGIGTDDDDDDDDDNDDS